MGWANCGVDSKGRPIGYAHRGTCDHPGCQKRINRGLAYACDNEHGATAYGCEGYFCPDHLLFANEPDGTGHQLCPACFAAFLKAHPDPNDEAAW